MTKLLVIGCASFDVLHLEQNGEESEHHTVGGAGLYTALAASRAGADVTLYAPKPEQLTDEFLAVDKLINWIGPTVPVEKMPRLDIVHHGAGRATLNIADWAAERFLLEENLPHPIEQFKIIHIAALSSASRQLAFLEYCRRHGAHKVSVGTYAKLLYAESETVSKLFEAADIFFMNQNEADTLFGSAEQARTSTGKLLFVTHGERGATVHVAGWQQFIPGCNATEVDPTGAGDTFCGATLAGLLRGESAVEAAHSGVTLAASCIESVGPVALMAKQSSS